MTGRVWVSRGALVESAHAVHVVVSDGAAATAWAGDPDRTTFLRSAAKPWQALPLVEDGVVRGLGITGEELALACGSHGGEPRHLEVAASLLARAGLGEESLACGPHPPLRGSEAQRLAATGQRPGRLHNNCSGKHAGMLALAVHHGWPTEGYHRAGHPVQARMADEVARWTGVPGDRLGVGVDGCGVLTFALPLAAMARGFARFARAAEAGEGGAGEVLAAMRAHPFMVAGSGRLCTAVLEATGGRVVPKVGAEGVYAAAVPGSGLGIALKVEDGARRAAEVALVEVLAQLGLLGGDAEAALDPWRRPPVRNTRDERVGEVRGGIEWDGPPTGG